MDGRRIKFWKDLWCKLKFERVFSKLFSLITDKDGWVGRGLDEASEGGV